MADLKAFAEQLVNLTVKEVNELADILKTEYGIEPAAAAAAVVVGPAGDDAAPVEKTEFDVWITGLGEKKLNVVKAVKSLTGLGLKEAKAVVDNYADGAVKEAVGKDEAEAMKTTLEEAGASVELK
ncbi:MAG: 50S ribosomal protein L7/L12 [Bacteroidota bacterium]